MEIRTALIHRDLPARQAPTGEDHPVAAAARGDELDGVREHLKGLLQPGPPVVPHDLGGRAQGEGSDGQHRLLSRQRPPVGLSMTSRPSCRFSGPVAQPSQLSLSGITAMPPLVVDSSTSPQPVSIDKVRPTLVARVSVSKTIVRAMVSHRAWRALDAACAQSCWSAIWSRRM